MAILLTRNIGPDYSRKRMLQAVEAAGVLDKREGVADTILSFVSEPEAAALATLKRVDGRCDVGADDCFVVCDCGGGTVDLIAYQVLTVEPMKIREIVKGSGGLAGASFLGARFKSLVKEKLDEIDPELWQHVSAADMEEIMSEEWPSMRRVFKGDATQSFTIRVPMSLFEAGLLIARGGKTTLRITSGDLKEVFRPILRKIETLVLGQIHSVFDKQGQLPKVSHEPSELGLLFVSADLFSFPAQYIVLVGGFGRCRYLYEWLKTRTRGIEVLQSQGNEP